jgi:hypothetical protein
MEYLGDAVSICHREFVSEYILNMCGMSLHVCWHMCGHVHLCICMSVYSATLS